MSAITTIIFDMYDTLAQNNARFWLETVARIIQEQGINADAERLWQEWRKVDAVSRQQRARPETPFRCYFETWQDAFSGAFAALDVAGDAQAATRRAFQDMGSRPAFPEVLEALGLVQRQWRTALLSNADDGYLRPNLARLGLEFSQVLSSQEARCYKPRPELFQEMLRRLDVTPQECCYVGDRQLEDVQGAGQVGMRTVWINRAGATPDPKLPDPDYMIRSLLELPALAGDIRK
ncbi:MAG: HAD family hydrolase [Dehalococcoidia bacterium]|nr:HAD family hydrolase [Dehalococcoidia bacterium]MSQ16113.1 HAD family hydrolase [Dehalococcoidia bacterium]